MKLRSLLLGLLAAMATTGAFAQVEFVEGDGTTAGIDTSGKGAVLCTWQILVTAQATREPCGVARQPIDDEIDAGIAKIDEFIVKNARRFPDTQESLAAEEADVVRTQLTVLAEQPEARAELCLVVEAFHGMPPWPSAARALAAQAMKHQVQALLSIPREPVMNPCL